MEESANRKRKICRFKLLYIIGIYMEKYFMAAIKAANLMGSQRVIKISNFFGSAEKAWNARREEIEKINLPTNALDSFLEFKKKFPEAPEMLEGFCEKKNFKLCCILDEDYPSILKKIPSPPAIFYYRGNLKTFAERVAIVGTRKNTEYGKKVALRLGEKLAAAGLTVVSGAADGIDTFAHVGAMKTGRTAAILGGGISYYFKSDKKNLLEEISENGIVVSEYSPNFIPNQGSFPARNKIIAGLSRGVIVVEAGGKSGALLTADDAKNFGRDVFAVPGNIFSEKSLGCNNLIKNGAILLNDFHDVLEKYNFAVEENLFVEESKKNSPPVEEKKILESKPVELNDAEKKIFDIIPAEEYITLDEILEQADDIDVTEISSIMLELELKNYIVEDAGRYTKKL